MKEVVLAFRAASHMNDSETSKTYKYSITDPEGMQFCFYTWIEADSIQYITKFK
jgi:hypothetical protein